VEFRDAPPWGANDLPASEKPGGKGVDSIHVAIGANGESAKRRLKKRNLDNLLSRILQLYYAENLYH
jgi:hypothetical protein